MKDICTFDNRVALVTGASGNIGLAVCRRLADYGVRIAACDMDAAVVEERTADLRAGGADIRAYSMEVTSRESVFAAIDAAIRDFGKIDIIVNNAGVSKLPNKTEETFHGEFAKTVTFDLPVPAFVTPVSV